MKILVTGGAGFIGSALVRKLIREGHEAINVDKLTYAGNLESLPDVLDNPRHHFLKFDICDPNQIRGAFEKYEPDSVIHLAAESHVDRSIDGPAAFLHTNVLGTHSLLEAAKSYWTGLRGKQHENFRFLHVSTDEVYGSLGRKGSFTEKSPHRPNSPYAATKASADHLVRAWSHTYGLPVLTTNCSNNYGPYQFPEKLIPLVIQKAVSGKPIPVYGKGQNVRDWIFVEDHADALMSVLKKGNVGEVYNIGGRAEKKNIEVVKTICTLLDSLLPESKHAPHARLITYVSDRPGHDLRYSIDDGKLTKQLKWKPKESFATGIRKTVEWYLKNQNWVNRVLDGSYQGERLGVIQTDLRRVS